MIFLVVDSSGPSAGVAVVRDGEVVYEGFAVNRMTHSANLMPMVEEALTRGGFSVADIDVFGAVTGPGSFTGVRIGVSTVKGLAHGAGKPCVGVDALEALAFSASSGDMPVCSILDARGEQVYGAAFLPGAPPKRLTPNMAEGVHRFVDAVRGLCEAGQRFCCVGNGAVTYRETLRSTLGKQACFLPAHLSVLRPAAAGLLAEMNSHQPYDYLQLQPQYLRAPQAVRAREAAMRKKTGLV